MLLSDFVGKEIINLSDGSKLGTVGDTDLVVSPDTGEIISLMLPYRGSGWGGLWGEKENIVIPWESVKKIGSEVVIVDLGEMKSKRYAE
ncbi:MAG TPA: YlmC/YmxH family sporulation protein [Verrucomicrobiae bacterium]|nr:YlmC/YmxH family sporulation protein [Verrucomicrobiae bacterium]